MSSLSSMFGCGVVVRRPPVPTPLAGWMSNPTTVAHPAVSGGAIGLGAPACSMPFQVAFLTLFVDYQTLRTAALVKDPGVSVNRVIWSPDGALFGKSFLILRDFCDHGGDEVRHHLEIDANVGGVNDLAFSHPNKQLCAITCGDDKTINGVMELGDRQEQIGGIDHTSRDTAYWIKAPKHILELVSSLLQVQTLMSETHELGGSAVVVDRATPKARRNCEDDLVCCLVVEVKEMLIKGFGMKYLLFRYI
ncbi:hypothetical protein V8G54_027662 [Vigna mungo]|uniref:Uncharacterized protein n=1 Tax=Vigna mungo TaxID=3915 RepID=A0AAQ3RQN2_VIGMU